MKAENVIIKDDNVVAIARVVSHNTNQFVKEFNAISAATNRFASQVENEFAMQERKYQVMKKKVIANKKAIQRTALILIGIECYIGYQNWKIKKLQERIDKLEDDKKVDDFFKVVEDEDLK